MDLQIRSHDGFHRIRRLKRGRARDDGDTDHGKRQSPDDFHGATSESDGTTVLYDELAQTDRTFCSL